ncbi:TPA: hypothetical protein DCP13_02855 [Candidatus Azambacteria bacterium]|nr:hypothetical protein [Candidatus Azambacteria bacterium]HAQ05712.1 hypothetical protein [Candidatus Azambacteria bacterium]
MAYPERPKRPEIPKTAETVALPESEKQEPEEKTVYGSFLDAVEECRGKIDAGEFKSPREFFAISRPVLLRQKGDLVKHYLEKQGLLKGGAEVGRAFNLLMSWDINSQLVRYPAMPDTIDFSSIADKESIEEYSREYPFAAVDAFNVAASDDFLELFDKNSIKNYLRKYPGDVVGVWAHTKSEKFLDLIGEECVKEYSRQNPKGALEDFVHAPPKVFGWLDKEAIKKYSSEDPRNALFRFSKSASEELFDLFDKESIKKSAREDPAAALNILVLHFDEVEKKTKKIFEILDKDFLKQFFHDFPEYVFNLCLRVNSKTLLDLIDFRQMKETLANLEEVADNRRMSEPEDVLLDLSPGVRMFTKNRALLERSDLRDFYSKLPENYFKERLERFKEERRNKTADLIKKGFLKNETELSIDLTDKELADLNKDFDGLFEENAKLKADEKLSTIGAEIEVLNNERAEIRLPVVSRENIKPLLQFFSDFSVLTFQKFDEVRKSSPEKFPGYPHSNLHLNYSLTEEQWQTSLKYGDVLEDISWCYSMAYSPFSRLAYLDGGHGRDKWNSNDTDVDIINPKTSGRYQVRYFSLGGSKNEIKSSLIGISKISALLPELFENSQKLERIKNFLKENDEIKNRALELRWIREQVGQLDEKRRDMSSSISTLKELDQKNGKFRNYFAKVQEMMQIELARFA